MTKSKGPSAAVAAALKNSATKPSEATVAKIRDEARRLRDIRHEIATLEERLKEKNAEAFKIERVTLPEIMMQAKVSSLGLEPEGNSPGYDAIMSPYYRANISTEWEPERRSEGYAYLAREKAADLLKNVIEIRLGRGENGKAKKIVTFLRKLGVDFSRDVTVPWGTLTAWLKERAEAGTIPDLKKIGGEVGRIVKLKPVEK